MKTTLERLSVFVDRSHEPFMTLAEAQTEPGIKRLLQTVRELTDAPTDTVAASVFFRRFGFFMAAQFQIIAIHQKMFAGPMEHVNVFHEDKMFKFSVPSTDFVNVEASEHALRFVLETYGHPLVELYSKQAKIPKLILWENIWGYVIWIYGQMIQENVESAKKDLDVLLLDETWKPHMRKSPFKQYLQNELALDAMKNYKRVTCCLLKEMPETDKCPYCPHAK